MSVDATRWAWSVQGVKSNDKLVLLSLADRAGEDHTAWPSHERLQLDTCLNPKTIDTSLKRLVKAGLIKDTGDRRGKTKRVKVFQLTLVEGREVKQPQKGNDSKSGEIKSPQKRNDTENGMIPNLDSNTPENGGTKYPQKRGAEPKRSEPNKEPTSDLAPSGENSPSTPSASPVVFHIPLNTGELFPITQEQLDGWRPAYPAVDLMQELHKINAWLEANPAKRKTKTGVLRFVVTWFGRTQDRGGNNPVSTVAAPAGKIAARNVVTDSQVSQFLRAGGQFRELPEAAKARVKAAFGTRQLPAWMVSILDEQEAFHD